MSFRTCTKCHKLIPTNSIDCCPAGYNTITADSIGSRPTIEDELRITRRMLTGMTYQYEEEKIRADKLQEKLNIALEALKFYADKHTYLREPRADMARRILVEDCDEVNNYARFCGGKKAREALVKLKETDK